MSSLSPNDFVNPCASTTTFPRRGPRGMVIVSMEELRVYSDAYSETQKSLYLKGAAFFSDLPLVCVRPGLAPEAVSANDCSAASRCFLTNKQRDKNSHA